MGLQTRVFEYGLAGTVAGLSAAGLVLLAFALLAGYAPTDFNLVHRPTPLRLATGWVMGGAAAGSVWGAVRPVTSTALGAAGAVLLSTLPFFVILRVVADPTAMTSADVGGVLARSLAVAGVMYVVVLASHLKVVAAPES